MSPKMICRHNQTDRLHVDSSPWQWKVAQASLVAARLLAVASLWSMVNIASEARGDQVITGGANHPNAKILNLDQGQLRFRTADGRMHATPLGDVELMIVDRGGVFEDFNQAERFLSDNEPQKAISRYERALRLTQEYWPDIVAARLCIAHDRAGQLDRAVFYWIRLLGGKWSGPTTSARLLPRNFPERFDGRASRSIELLGEAVRRSSDETHRALLELLQFEILRRTGDARSDDIADRLSARPVGAAIRTRDVYTILLRAMDISARRNPLQALSSIDPAIRDCPDESLAGFLLLKGRLLLQNATTREEIIRGAWCFLRVAIHRPDDAETPAALVDAAKAMIRLERPDQARALLEEGLAHANISAELRSGAETLLAELRGGLKNTP